MTSICAIVGAGEGLGSALAAKFSSEGFDIALISRSESGSRAANDAVLKSRADADVRFFAADASFPETIEKALDRVALEMGDIEVLIYNVRDSYTKCEPLDMSFDAIDKVHKLEVVSAFAAAKSVLPGMRSRGQGSIFFSSATSAFRGSAQYPLYSIGKFGMRALSQSLAKAYAQDRVHIVHVRMDLELNVPFTHAQHDTEVDPNTMSNTEDVALSYWHTHLQPKSAWSNEIELRPYTETWTI
jgi:NAD(P)-dependent dehydrogenase (short-subunit alcohol dehydrogenase family)